MTGPEHRYGTPADRDDGPPLGPLSPPLIRSTTWAAADAATAARLGAREDHAGFYSRYGHPAGRRVEAEVAALEGADGAVAFASGMAAVHAVLFGLCSAGDRVLLARQVYGGTDALARLDLPRLGIEVERFDATSPRDLERALARPARLCWVETPVNPTLRLVDLATVASACRAAGVTTVCDGTFAPPPLQFALGLGIDLVFHSATKFFGGHSDVLAGVVAGPHELLGPIEAFRARSGGVLEPDAAWLLLRSLATHGLRVAAQVASATTFASELAARVVEAGGPLRRVIHPSLPDHPDRALVERQMPGGGGALVTLEVDGGLEGAVRCHDRLRRIARAPSLGGVETLVSLPLLSSHAKVPAAERAAVGVSDGMLRVSVGLEPVADLVADVVQALGGAG